MREVLQALLISGAVMLATAVGAVLWLRHRLRRRLRIAPGQRSLAPTAWIVPVTGGARLHRRLRLVGVSACTTSVLDPSLAAEAQELVGEAVALERPVVALAGHRRAASRTGRRDLAARIARLEAVGTRLAALAADPTPSSAQRGGARLHDRVTALEAARRELDEIELQAGLLRHA